MNLAGMAAALFPRSRRWRILALALVTAIVVPAAGQEKPTSDFDCLIQPKMLLKLGAPTPSLISEVLVDRGTLVKKGDVVARLESSVEKATLDLAQARAEDDSTVVSAHAKVDFQRRKEDRAAQLKKVESIALSAADEAETGARVAESDLRQAEANLLMAQLDMARSAALLNLRTLRSPIDGVVVERTLGPGEYAFDQSHLITIAQIDPLVVDVFVPLSEFGKIKAGMPAEVLPEQPVGGRYHATVTIVDKVFDAASATIGVRLELPNPDYTLPAGLQCKIRFTDVAHGAPKLEPGRVQPAILQADGASSQQLDGNAGAASPSVHREQSPAVAEKPQMAPAESPAPRAVPLVQSEQQGEYGKEQVPPPQLDRNAAPELPSAQREQSPVVLEKPQAPAAPAELPVLPAIPVVQSEQEAEHAEEQVPLPHPKPHIAEVKKGATLPKLKQPALPLAPAATSIPRVPIARSIQPH
jgi:RND family efflux transporter MFP subunit